MSIYNQIIYLNQARKNQWLNPSELERMQIKKLRSMIEHAYQTTEFYHNKFKNAGIHPSDILTMKDISNIPFTTKEELRQQELKSLTTFDLDMARCDIKLTSGSTGIPLKIVYDEAAGDFSKAINLRSHVENGLKLFSKWVVFGNPFHNQSTLWFQKLKIFSPFQISALEPIEKQIESLLKFNPEVLDGYTSSIRLVADTIEKEQIKGICPDVVFGTSEFLDSETRKKINSIFNVEMIDHYGCVEFNRMAWECSEHSGYHIDSDAVLMEFIDNGENVSPGERGEIVCSGLYNYAMPLIRYRIGDIGVPSEESCPCGRGLPLMKSIEGRQDSFFRLSDGRVISPIVWTLIMRKISGFSHFKIIQHTINSIKILIVQNEDFSDKTLLEIESDVIKLVGDDVSIDIEITMEIPKERSGKVRAVVSNVDSNLVLCDI